MEVSEYLRFVIALAFVVALIGIFGVLARRYGMGYRNVPKRKNRRLTISEIMPLDNKRRLILVKRDEKEHLILIGGETDLLIESNISEDPDFNKLVQGEFDETEQDPHPTSEAPSGDERTHD